MDKNNPDDNEKSINPSSSSLARPDHVLSQSQSQSQSQVINSSSSSSQQQDDANRAPAAAKKKKKKRKHSKNEKSSSDREKRKKKKKKKEKHRRNETDTDNSLMQQRQQQQPTPSQSQSQPQSQQPMTEQQHQMQSQIIHSQYHQSQPNYNHPSHQSQQYYSMSQPSTTQQSQSQNFHSSQQYYSQSQSQQQQIQNQNLHYQSSSLSSSSQLNLQMQVSQNNTQTTYAMLPPPPVSRQLQPQTPIQPNDTTDNIKKTKKKKKKHSKKSGGTSQLRHSNVPGPLRELLLERQHNMKANNNNKNNKITTIEIGDEPVNPLTPIDTLVTHTDHPADHNKTQSTTNSDDDDILDIQVMSLDSSVAPDEKIITKPTAVTGQIIALQKESIAWTLMCIHTNRYVPSMKDYVGSEFLSTSKNISSFVSKCLEVKDKEISEKTTTTIPEILSSANNGNIPQTLNVYISKVFHNSHCEDTCELIDETGHTIDGWLNGKFVSELSSSISDEVIKVGNVLQLKSSTKLFLWEEQEQRRLLEQSQHIDPFSSNNEVTQKIEINRENLITWWTPDDLIQEADVINLQKKRQEVWEYVRKVGIVLYNDENVKDEKPQIVGTTNTRVLSPKDQVNITRTNNIQDRNTHKESSETQQVTVLTNARANTNSSSTSSQHTQQQQNNSNNNRFQRTHHQQQPPSTPAKSKTLPPRTQQQSQSHGQRTGVIINTNDNQEREKDVFPSSLPDKNRAPPIVSNNNQKKQPQDKLLVHSSQGDIHQVEKGPFSNTTNNKTKDPSSSITTITTITNFTHFAHYSSNTMLVDSEISKIFNYDVYGIPEGLSEEEDDEEDNDNETQHQVLLRLHSSKRVRIHTQNDELGRLPRVLLAKDSSIWNEIDWDEE